MTKKVNWLKVLANAGVAFFSTLAGILTVNALCNGAIPVRTLVLAAGAVGLIQAGLAFFKELASAVGSNGNGPGPQPETTMERARRYREGRGLDREDLHECGRHKTACLVLGTMTLF